MADGVELIPVDDQDIEERVFRGWEDGKGPQVLSREFAIPIRRVEEIIDRLLPVFDAPNQLRAFKRELRRLEDLSGEFYTIAKRDKCRDSAHLVARLNERICAMRGWSPVNIRIGTDPFAVQAEQQPSSYEKIKAAIMSLKYGPDWQPDDRRNNGNGDGAAADVPSLPDATNGGSSEPQ